MYMYIYACFSLISVFFSRALCLYIMMDASDDYMQGELCLIECSKTNPSLREDEHWKCKGILHVFFSMQVEQE